MRRMSSRIAQEVTLLRGGDVSAIQTLEGTAVGIAESNTQFHINSNVCTRVFGDPMTQ